MHVVEKNIWINCTSHEAFELHSNHANRVEWHDHVIRSEMITSEPVGAGSQFEIDTIVAGRSVPMVIEIIAFEPYHYYGYRSTTSRVITDSHQYFEEENGGTRVKLRIEIEFQGLMNLFGWFILKFGLENHFETALRELKVELEQ